MVVSTGQVISASDINYGANMFIGAIVSWSGSIADISAGWIICDGLNGTPNLLGKFIEGVATASTNPGATGGATTKSLDIGGNTGNITATTQIVVETQTGVLTVKDTGGETPVGHFPVSNLISDIRPLFYDVAFLYKT